MSLLSLILNEKDPNGNVKQLCGSDLSKISESELKDYLLNVRRTNLDLSRTRLTRRQLLTVGFSRSFIVIVHVYYYHLFFFFFPLTSLIVYLSCFVYTLLTHSLLLTRLTRRQLWISLTLNPFRSFIVIVHVYYHLFLFHLSHWLYISRALFWFHSILTHSLLLTRFTRWRLRTVVFPVLIIHSHCSCLYYHLFFHLLIDSISLVLYFLFHSIKHRTHSLLLR